VGGTVSGITGTVILQNNGGDNLSVSGNSAFAFPTAVSSGGAYAVTVFQQPTNQTCVVSGGSGMANAVVTSVMVTCTTNSHHLGGTLSGVFGAGLVIANGADMLALPADAQTFTMPTLVLAGANYAVTVQSQPVGLTCSVTNGAGVLPDNDVTTLQIACVPKWTWITGQHTDGVAGIYGTLGVPAAGNMPGGRQYALSWADSSGHLWLFGGFGYGEGFVSGYGDYLNDLWSYDTSTGLWTWVSGSATAGAVGVYGTKGVGATTNTPGPRGYSITWTDASGNLWLFGGFGTDAAGTAGSLNDLWKFNPTNNQWTWVSGSNTVNAPGVYGTQGVAASASVPGARNSSVSWTDGAGNLWLYGGLGFIADGTGGTIGDLWKYDPAANLWTWVSGTSTVAAAPVYGTQNVADVGNDPGARLYAMSWYDGAANLWLFGGDGASIANDLWKFDLTAGMWTWVSGSQQGESLGNYGVQGVAAASNVPGSRSSSVSWTDKGGNLWLLGGFGHDSATLSGGGFLSDVWKFDRATSQWIWVAGSNVVMTTGVYGTQGVADPANAPGGRDYATAWYDSNGTVWLFGGQVWGPTTLSGGYFNDLWRY
jgi:N-acetylneuraminic acid mutarotase